MSVTCAIFIHTYFSATRIPSLSLLESTAGKYFVQ